MIREKAVDVDGGCVATLTSASDTQAWNDWQKVRNYAKEMFPALSDQDGSHENV